MCLIRFFYMSKNPPYFGLFVGDESFTVILNRRILGLSYSSMDMPRDKRLPPAPSLEPLEPDENARERSTPGMATDVSKP